MSLLQRKPRPLARDAASFRDDRLFIVACDDTFAPKQYFDFYKIPRVHVNVVTTTDGTSVAEHVLGRLLEFEHEDDDELWMLLDTDHCTSGRHAEAFWSAIKKAKDKGVKVALSKPCFELWLLLHHKEESGVKALATCREVEKALRKQLGEYNKTLLKEEHYPLAYVCEACRRAERLDALMAESDKLDGNRTEVHKLWRSIAAKALPSQLPGELRGLLR